MLKENSKLHTFDDVNWSPKNTSAASIPAEGFPVIDLFAGAGGFSLGAARAGFRVFASVEIDRYANETHARNFPLTKHLGSDVAALSGDDLKALTGLHNRPFGLIGGPPCQGFSEIGHRDPGDARNLLFGHFMRIVHETRPAFFLAENVPGILRGTNAALVQEALSLIPPNYVQLTPHKVCAASFGAATSRTRVFFAGFDPSQCVGFSEGIFYPDPSVPRITVAQALEGLPRRVDSAWTTEAEGWRPVELLQSSFFADRAQGMIPPGVGEEFSIDALELGYVSGCLGTNHTATSIKRFRKLLPGGREDVSKSVRLDPEGVCPTLRAGTGSDRGSYQAVRPIHPTEPRVITPREAARLQGFPDWYAFHPTKWHSFRQIGNSVCPLVAEGILRSIFKAIGKSNGEAKQVHGGRRRNTS